MENSEVVAVIRGQFGVASVAQLIGCGVSTRTVRRARDRGALVEMLRGVLRSAAFPDTFEARAMAALLACGPHSFLSGTTAGAVHGLRSMPRHRIAVTAPGRRYAQWPRWVDVSSTGWLEPRHLVRRGPLRISSPLRTLLELAAEFNDYRFERAAEDAWNLKLVTPADAAEFLKAARASGRHGVTRFERWLRSTIDRDRASQSSLEMTVLDAIRRAGLPEPQRQFPLTLPNGEVIHLDLAWPDRLIGVEPGHSWWHGGRLQMAADAARDRACGELGWLIVRFDEDACRDIRSVGAQLRRIHAHRPTVLSGP